MAIRFTASAGNQYLDAVDDVDLTFPNGDWTLCFFLNVIGSIGDPVPGHYAVSTGAFNTANTVNVYYIGANQTAEISVNGASTNNAVGSHISGWKLYSLRRSGTTLTLRLCDILLSLPTDGSAVSEISNVSLSVALDGAGLTIGARQSDKDVPRLLDDSMTRAFKINQALTDFEIAKLAYGMEVTTDLGYTPSWYIPMTTNADFTDVMGNITVTKSGTPTTDTEPVFGFTSPPADTITPTDQTNHRVFQRIGTSANIVFSGTNTGTTPTDVQVQLYAADGVTVLQAWTTLASATINSTTFAGTLSVPQYQNMYRFAVRSRDAGGVVLATSPVSTNQWGVGDIWVLIGSSGSEYWANSESGTGFTSNAGVKRYNQSDVWAAGGTVGAIIQAANTANTALGVAIGFMECGVSGTLLVNWAAQDANWTEFLSDLANVGGKVGLVNIHVGTNDAANGIVVSKAQHKTNYLTFINNIRTAAGQSSLPIFISGSNGRTSAQNQQYDWIREVEKELGNELNIYFGATTVDLEIDADNIHLTPSGYQAALARLSLAHLDVFGSGTFHRGAFVSGFSANGTTGLVTITHVGGTDITVDPTVAGFTASDASGSLTVNSAIRASANTIALTFGRTINSTVTLKYASGARPFESWQGVRDNTALALPLEVETDGINAVILVEGSYTLQSSINNFVEAEYTFSSDVYNYIIGEYIIDSSIDGLLYANGSYTIDSSVRNYVLGSYTFRSAIGEQVISLPSGSGFVSNSNKKQRPANLQIYKRVGD